MVDALGVSGYEGGFRRSSEITLEFLRNHEDMVMTMLETFSHDPINDWSKKKRAVSPPEHISKYFQVFKLLSNLQDAKIFKAITNFFLVGSKKC